MAQRRLVETKPMTITTTKTKAIDTEAGNLKVTATRKDFLVALDRVIAPAFKNSSLPICNTVRVSSVNGKIRLETNNLETAAITTLPDATIKTPGGLCFPARQFRSLLNSLPEGAVTLAVDGQAAHLAGGKSKFRVNGLPAEDFSDYPKSTSEVCLKLPQGILKEAIAHTSYALQDPKMHALQASISMELTGNLATFVATDTHRLAYRQFTLAEENEASVLLSSPCIAEWSKALATTEDPVIFEVCKTDNGHSVVQLTFPDTDTKIMARQVEGRYPMWQRVVPANHLMSWTLSMAELETAVSRAMLVATENANRIWLMPNEAGGLTVRAQSQLNEAETEIEANVVGDGFVTSWNGAYVADALAVLKQFPCEQVRLELSAPLKPGILRPVTDGDCGAFALLMPMNPNASGGSK